MTSGRYRDAESDLPEIPDWVNPGPAEAATAPRWRQPIGPGPEPDADYHPDVEYHPDGDHHSDADHELEDPAGEPEDPAGELEDPAGEPDVDHGFEPAPVPDDHWLSRRERHPRRSSGWGRRLLLGFGIFLVFLVVAGVGLIAWVNSHLNGSGGAPVDVTLPGDAGHGLLTSTLTKAGVVSDGWLFRRYLDYRGTPPARGGKYTFHHHEGYRAALHDLGQGPKIVQLRLTIPEGYDLKQIAAVVGGMPGLSAQKFLDLAQSGAVRSTYEPDGSNNLEGLVFPDTYFVDPGESEQMILQRLVSRFDQIANQAGLANSQATNGLTPYQTVIVASLIEKEAKVPQDRGKIARVILNRLAHSIRLQIDATVLYAEGVHKDKVLNSDLKVSSPYNTYKIAGLPPGPIASPGQASLAAALNPTPGTWLYYVLINADGTHGFATTQREFNQLLSQARAKGLI